MNCGWATLHIMQGTLLRQIMAFTFQMMQGYYYKIIVTGHFYFTIQFSPSRCIPGIL